MFDETCKLTDGEAQEATIRACHSVNPGIIIVGIPRTVTKSRFEFCTTLCTWQHKRGALHILILRDSEEALSEEQFLALVPSHQSEGSASLGRDLRQMETGARLDSNLPAMSRVRVWTNTFTMAEQIQQEAVAGEGPLHSEELPFQWHRHNGSSESAGSRKSNPNMARHLSWDTLPPGRTKAGHDSYRDFLHIATVLVQTL